MRRKSGGQRRWPGQTVGVEEHQWEYAGGTHSHEPACTGGQRRGAKLGLPCCVYPVCPLLNTFMIANQDYY